MVPEATCAAVQAVLPDGNQGARPTQRADSSHVGCRF